VGGLEEGSECQLGNLHNLSHTPLSRAVRVANQNAVDRLKRAEHDGAVSPFSDADDIRLKLFTKPSEVVGLVHMRPAELFMKAR
jgi:hypothetical protein